MAGSTISITFKMEGDDKTFKQLAASADGLKRAMTGVISEASQLKGSIINFAALATGIDAAQRSFTQLQGAMQDLANAYAVQETAERKLETVMQQRMGATDAEIQSIKDLASAQQEIGVIGDEVQLSGAQQVATFLTQKSSIETLLPAMNNLLAQQKGLNATTGDAVSVANLMGKAMQGQTSALTRVGITFTEAQENVMKYGTEAERAAMLAQIITDNVGNMNQELALTESGRQQQLANTLGDVKEQIGGLVNGALPFVTIAAQASQALAAVSTLVAGIKTLTVTMYDSVKAFAVSTIAFIKNKGAALALAAAQKAVSAVTVAWTAVQKVLNLVLTANPIGLIIVAVGALVAAVIYAYNNCESFRNIVNKVWEAIKPLATAIMNGLAKAFEWLVEKCKAAWDWLKKILGLGGKKVEVKVDVSKPKAAPSIDLAEAEKRYAKASVPAIKSPGAAAEANAPDGSIAAIAKQINVLRTKIELSVDEGSRARLYKELDALELRKRIVEFRYKFPEAPKRSDILPDLGTTLESDIAKVKPDIEDLSKTFGNMGKKAEASTKEAADAFGQLGGSISGLGNALEIPELNVAGTMAQAIATMVSGYAVATAKGAKLGPFGWIAFAAAGLAQLTAMVSAVKALPAFANGGIVSGPTVGLIGEYAGASSNPEVIAPLDKLRGMLNPAGAPVIVGGTLRASGRDLVCVLANETRIASKSGRKTNIKL